MSIRNEVNIIEMFPGSAVGEPLRFQFMPENVDADMSITQAVRKAINQDYSGNPESDRLAREIGKQMEGAFGMTVESATVHKDAKVNPLFTKKIAQSGTAFNGIRVTIAAEQDGG